MSTYDPMDWYRRHEAAFDSIRFDLAELIGYHDRDGAVPIEKLQAAIDKAVAIAEGQRHQDGGAL